jgi:hypothetical protein
MEYLAVAQARGLRGLRLVPYPRRRALGPPFVAHPDVPRRLRKKPIDAAIRSQFGIDIGSRFYWPHPAGSDNVQE